ncbi:MAG TPA: hypothetical protein VGO40_02050 [Longimicrobium sp.]|nr:hypothetical protein [Longimicrobium sp.]
MTGPAGEKQFDLVAGTRVVLRTTLLHAAGPASRPAFTSRAPNVVSVDSSGAVRGISSGRAFVVGSVTERARVLMDSVEVRVECTTELRVHTFPRDTVIRVGESFVARADLASCGGFVRLDDVLTWRARDAAVVRVDSVSGRTVGFAPGDTWVDFSGRKYGRFEGVHVRVVSPR